MAVVLTELKTHLNADAAGDYAVHVAAGNHAEITRLLNETLTATTIDVPSITPAELLEAIWAPEPAETASQTRTRVTAEYAAMAVDPLKEKFLGYVLGIVDIPVTDAPGMKGLLSWIWQASTSPTIRDHLIESQSRLGLRSETVGVSSAFGDRVKHEQVGQALSLP